MQLGHYINPAQLAAEREAEQAMKAAEQAALEAAMDAIPDNAFDDHPEVIDLRNKLTTATAELKAAKAARAKIDKNPTPARVEELEAEIARREPALRVAEAAAVAKGDTAMPEVLKVRAELRTLADELASLESGWAGFLAGIEIDTTDANLTELARVRDMFEVRADETILRLKRERVDGTEARSLERLRIAEEGAARRREAAEATERERMKHVGLRAQQFKARKAAALAQNRISPAS
jgi:hypothetical protein